MESRTAEIHRMTGETDVLVRINLDGEGNSDVVTGIGFFDHMLDAFARHGMFDLFVRVEGDLHVDGHHSIEDTGIVLGQALAEAIGDKRGIVRFGSSFVPMDEALMLAVCDFSGRGQLHWDVAIEPWMLGDFDSTLAKEFFIALATNAQITLHVKEFAGENIHHVIEAVFKSVARALREATSYDARQMDKIPSTKGVL
ncbi:imidazoleglycerol-phosphate dehydratase HisB [Eggerthellaceae bacterium 3-80]|nr:imidazoleglycerol-phosphate dehydratase HisB [bacterium D16-34]